MQNLWVQSLYIKYIHYIPHKTSLRKIKWKDVFIENSLLPTNLCQRTVMHYCIQIWKTTQPSRRQGNFCPYYTSEYGLGPCAKVATCTTDTPGTRIPSHRSSAVRLFQRMPHVSDICACATLPLYTFAARTKTRLEVRTELVTTRKRFGVTRARWVWRGGITLGICSCSTRTKWCHSGISNG